MDTLQLRGIPYAPGYAKGRLQRQITKSATDIILLVEQHQFRCVAEHKPAGLVVVDGAPFSHAMIQLLSLEIPIVIIGEKDVNQFPQGIDLEIDGSSGSIKQLPAPQSRDYRPPPAPLFGQPVQSADAVDVSLCASVSSAESTTKALNKGIKGALGLQGVRLYDWEAIRRVMYAQVSALEHLHSQYRLQLIIPYVSSLGQFRRWRNTIHQLMSKPIPIGAMLETPATVLDINNWLNLADFAAIGTNDLMQCLYGADRDLHQVQRYLNPYNPVLLRVLQQAAKDAGDGISRVQLCGLLTQFPGILPLLLGMGYRLFSVEPRRIPYLARTIAQTNIAQTRQLTQQACSAPNAKSVCKLLNVALAPIWADDA